MERRPRPDPFEGRDRNHMGVTLIDTSVWIEYLRGTGSDANVRVREMIGNDDLIATCDVVIMELLSGTKSQGEWNAIWALMNRCRMLPVRPLFDYEVAARLYRKCRASGFQPQSMSDLLVAAVAIGKDVPVLTADEDFARIAELSTLRLVA